MHISSAEVGDDHGLKVGVVGFDASGGDLLEECWEVGEAFLVVEDGLDYSFAAELGVDLEVAGFGAIFDENAIIVVAIDDDLAGDFEEVAGDADGFEFIGEVGVARGAGASGFDGLGFGLHGGFYRQI